MKTMEIGNETFTIKKWSYIDYDIQHVNDFNGRTIFSAYKNPSNTKIEQYDRWAKWARENDAFCFGVSGANSSFFSLMGFIFIDNTKYIFKITYANNYIYPIG